MEYHNPKDLKPHPISVSLYGDNHIDDLLESIKQYGILTPLTITKEKRIISGHRRWRVAIQIGLTSIPVEVKTYDSELAEKRAILEFNRQREKTFSQKMNEAKLHKEIESELAKKISLSQLKQNTDMDICPPRNKLTRDIVAEQVGIGSGRTLARAEKIWDKAQEGDEQAITLIKELDTGDKTIHRAYTELFDKAHVSHNTGESEWYTPKQYIDAARAVMASIDLDPASSDTANKIVQANKYFTQDDDGLKHPWHGNVWMNPPYSQPLVSDFCELLVKNYKEGNIRQACILVNNATETNFYQNILANCNAVCFIKGRVKFVDEQGNESGTPLQGQTILYFGKNRDKFSSQFSRFGVILYAIQAG